MSTMAEQWAATKRQDYTSSDEMLDLILSIDEYSEMVLENGRVFIKFSDGTKARLGSVQ